MNSQPGDWLDRMAERYNQFNRKGKSRILDEVCETLGLHRKSAIRALNRRAAPREPVPRRGPEPVYRGETLLVALQKIWSAAEQPCGKRLAEAIALWLPALEKRMEIDGRTRELLLAMSASTADRLLAPMRARAGRGRCTTRPGTLTRSKIPIRTGPWDVTIPGYVEADTVAHCGTTTAGSFVYSLTFTDIATGWTENRATWNRGAEGVRDRIVEIEKDLPFELLGFDCDNGSEFLNHHLLTLFTERPKKVEFTRSRPYRKNDQAHVEQKNWTHVRQLLGYERLEHPELVGPINELYRLWGLLHNFFCPTLKLKSRERVDARIVKRYHRPRTPAQRLIDGEKIDPEVRQQLEQTLAELDPFDLHRQIRAALRKVHNLRRRLDQDNPPELTMIDNSQHIQDPLGNTFP